MEVPPRQGQNPRALDSPQNGVSRQIFCPKPWWLFSTSIKILKWISASDKVWPRIDECLLVFSLVFSVHCKIIKCKTVQIGEYTMTFPLSTTVYPRKNVGNVLCHLKTILWLSFNLSYLMNHWYFGCILCIAILRRLFLT